MECIHNEHLSKNLKIYIFFERVRSQNSRQGMENLQVGYSEA